MTSSGICFCAAGCARNPMADPGAFGQDCSCWCHAKPAGDPLLAALADARQRKQQADKEIRVLLAYARERVTPRPYRLADLADAAGMSISGVRVAYTRTDTDQVARAIGTDGQRHLQQAITILLAQAKRQAASGRRITAA